MYTTTIQCQLDILLYLQLLKENVPEICVESINTDGANLIYKEKYEMLVNNITKEWEHITNSEMESTYYEKVVRSDVNNYIAIKTDGKIKYKGLFEIDKELHKDFSFHIIPMALSNYYVHNIPITDTVYNNKCIYDFLGTCKVQGTAQGTWSLYHSYLKSGKHHKDLIQKINRYYVTKDPSSYIIKELDSNSNKWSYIEAGYNVKPLNKVEDETAQNYDINYGFYLTKIQKIITQIKGNEKIW